MQTKKEHTNSQTLHLAYKVVEGANRINTHNLLRHELAKTKVIYLLTQQGHKVISEAIFENKSRCDILDLTTGTIYEILESEKLVDAKTKEVYYPPIFGIYYLQSTEVMNEEFDL